MLVIQKEITGLRRVKSVPNPSRQNARDGIFEVDNAYYILTFCHAERNGDIYLQMFDQMYDITPNTIRQQLQDVLGYTIPENKMLFLTPCFPKAVKGRHGKELAENNIFVVGDWNQTTWFHMGCDYNNNHVEEILYLKTNC